MKKKILVVLSIIFLLTGCNASNSSIKNGSVKQDTSLKVDEKMLNIEKARNDVIEKFKNERDVLGTGKFIEDTYKKYPDDEIISTIYFYQNSIMCYDFYLNSKTDKWLQQSKGYASKISPDYDGAFKDEIIPYVKEMLGDDWLIFQKQTIKQDEKYNSLTVEDKVEINKYIEDRYTYYDKKEGKNTGDKYSDKIWKEASEKYGLSEGQISSIYSDIYVMEEINKENYGDNISYDAILNYENGSSIIAISEDYLDRFINALVNGNEGTINELYNTRKIAQVPKGTHVNIIKKKLTKAKVMILDGMYKDNEVWILIESLQE